MDIKDIRVGAGAASAGSGAASVRPTERQALARDIIRGELPQQMMGTLSALATDPQVRVTGHAKKVIETAVAELRAQTGRAYASERERYRRNNFEALASSPEAPRERYQDISAARRALNGDAHALTARRKSELEAERTSLKKTLDKLEPLLSREIPPATTLLGKLGRLFEVGPLRARHQQSIDQRASRAHGYYVRAQERLTEVEGLLARARLVGAPPLSLEDHQRLEWLVSAFDRIEAQGGVEVVGAKALAVVRVLYQVLSAPPAGRTEARGGDGVPEMVYRYFPENQSLLRADLEKEVADLVARLVSPDGAVGHLNDELRVTRRDAEWIRAMSPDERAQLLEVAFSLRTQRLSAYASAIQRAVTIRARGGPADNTGARQDAGSALVSEFAQINGRYPSTPAPYAEFVSAFMNGLGGELPATRGTYPLGGDTFGDKR